MILGNAELHPALGRLLDEATEFMRLFHRETHQDDALPGRLRDVESEVLQTGTYRHTEAELLFGAQVAWRNSVRCVGRHYWRSLRLLDRRDVSTFEGVCESLCEYLRVATNRGHIQPHIVVFAPARPGRGPMRIWNEQLIRYAGYRQADGSVVGDPRYVELTEVLRGLGWAGGPGTRFDRLPLAIELPDSKPRLFEIPDELVLEVPIVHPEFPAFADLGLKWHAVPAISAMRLEVGGIDYTCAPFNGWYMGAEVGARNLSDTNRYDMLPAIAKILGLKPRRNASLWKDRALVELNVAVLYSYEKAGVQMVDHHTVCDHFLKFEEGEAKAGRETYAEWSWVVPPISGSVSPLFHHPFERRELKPNFFWQDLPWRAGAAGGCPFHHNDTG